jgi:hypothetical protein
VPKKNDANDNIEQIMHPVLLPHEVVACAYDEGHPFTSTMLGDPARLRYFWDGARSTKWFAAHPARGMDLDRMIPIVLHGDDAPYCDTDSVLVMQWHPAMTHGPSLDLKCLFTLLSCHECVMVDGANRTLEVLHEVWAWSCSILLTGHWPHAGPQGPWDLQDRDNAVRAERVGTAFAGGFRLAFVGTKGDLKFLKSMYRWDRHYQCNFCCPLCLAHKRIARLFYGNTLPNAPWRETVLSHENIMHEYTAKGTLPPIMSTPGWHAELSHLDLMHNLYLGVGPDVAASIMLEMLREMFWGDAEPDVQLKKAHVRFLAWCTAHGEKTSQRVFERVDLGVSSTLAGWPKLKAKAANCKLVLLWLAEEAPLSAVAERSDYSRLRATCAWSLGQFISVLENADMWLSPAEVQSATLHGRTFLVTYARLSDIAREAERTLYTLRPKLHYIDHQVSSLRAMPWNPRFLQCFGDEDMMGRMAVLVAATHRTTLVVRSVDIGTRRMRAVSKHNTIYNILRQLLLILRPLGARSVICFC